MPGRGSLTVRPATRADVDGLVVLYESLSTDDRRRRFFTAARAPHRVLERLIDATEQDGLWLVAVTADGEIVADGGYTRLPDGDAELALTVKQSWRGWLGSYLLDALVHDAAEHGVRNLRADILAENRPMLKLAERRGYATVDEPDWTIVNVTIATDGERPGWPPVDDRRRVLIEGCTSRWHGDVAAWAAGWNVISCAGPGARSVPMCPVLEGRPCPLAHEADLIVVAMRPDDPRRQALVDAHADQSPAVPIVDEATATAEELKRRLAEDGGRPRRAGVPSS